MKIYGYGDRVPESDAYEFREITFCGTPDELRQVAKFLKAMATELEAGTFRPGHRHMSYVGWKDLGNPDLIVSYWPE